LLSYGFRISVLTTSEEIVAQTQVSPKARDTDASANAVIFAPACKGQRAAAWLSCESSIPRGFASSAISFLTLNSPLEAFPPIGNGLQIGREPAHIVIEAQLHGRPQL